jgi:protein-disulfide isomerase
VIENYPEQVKIVYKNFPIRSHKFSEPAAKAALAAQKQGKFWPKIVYKNFPIRSHKFSEPAAKAALAAQKQGKFWPFHDLLYAHYKELSDKKIREIANQLKLDMVRFEKDRKSPAIAGKVSADLRDGSKAGIRGVPAVFINGRRLRKRSLEGFSGMIEKELEKAGNSSPQKINRK